jgi:hypothetical protein
MAAVPVAAEENSPIQSGLKLAVKNALAETASASAEAQATPAASTKPNSGNITFTSNFELLPGTAYVFRGITQESDPEVTMWPSGDVGFALHSSDTGALRTVSVNTGVWNSLHTGTSGLDGPSEKLHYEEDYYATLTLAFSKASFATTYTAYTSPNDMFGTTQEIAFKISPTYRYGRTSCWRRSCPAAPTRDRTKARISSSVSWVRAGDCVLESSRWRFLSSSV